MFGDLVGLKLPDIRLTGKEKPRKNLSQGTCPDRESNPGPLHGKCACYHLLHSSGHEWKGEGEIRWWLIACFSRKASRGPPGLTSPSYGWIAIKITICLLNTYTAEGFGILSRPVMYNLAIRKCTSPSLLALRLKIYDFAGYRTPDMLNQRQTCYLWASVAH